MSLELPAKGWWTVGVFSEERPPKHPKANYDSGSGRHRIWRGVKGGSVDPRPINQMPSNSIRFAIRRLMTKAGIENLRSTQVGGTTFLDWIKMFNRELSYRDEEPEVIPRVS